MRSSPRAPAPTDDARLRRYFYFFCTNIGWYKFVAPVAPLVTTMQISQMVVGTLVIIRSAYLSWIVAEPLEGCACDDPAVRCSADPANLRLGLVMYTSYFALFVALFVDKYNVGGRKKRGDGDAKEEKVADSSKKSPRRRKSAQRS